MVAQKVLFLKKRDQSDMLHFRDRKSFPHNEEESLGKFLQIKLPVTSHLDKIMDAVKSMKRMLCHGL
jgi:hypothetical protein